MPSALPPWPTRSREVKIDETELLESESKRVSWDEEERELDDFKTRDSIDVRTMPSLPPDVYPRSQIIAICWMRISHPMLLKVIFPFVVQMAHALLPDVPLSEIGSYTGAMEGVYAMSTSLFALYAANLANVYGRKRTVVVALLGSWLCSTLFGFSKSFWLAFALRAIAGAFQTAQPILRALMAESSTKESEAANFGAYASSFWAGVCVAPIIGGALSEPADRYSWAADIAWLKAYPYALPGLVSGTFMLAGILFTLVKLQETYQPGYSRISDTPTTPATVAEENGVWMLLTTRRTALLCVNWTSNMLIHSSYDAVTVLYAATPIAIGGLGLTTPEIGVALTINALTMVILCFTVFPTLKDRWGMQRLARWTTPINVLMFLSMVSWNPIAASIPAGDSRWRLWLAMSLTLVCRLISGLPVMALEVLISSAAPKRSLNAQMSALMSCIGNGAWALGPLVSCNIFARTIANDPQGSRYCFYVLACFGALNIAATWPMREGGGWRDLEAKEAAERESSETTPRTSRL